MKLIDGRFYRPMEARWKLDGSLMETPNFLDFRVSFLYINIQRVRQLSCPAPYICDFVLLYRTEP